MGILLIIVIVVLVLGGFILIGYFAKKNKGKIKQTDSNVSNRNIPTKE